MNRKIIVVYLFFCNNFINVSLSLRIYTLTKRSARGGRPATTISRPSHILLIFLSEPPRNPRPFNVIFKTWLIFFTRIFRYSWCRMPQISEFIELQSFLLIIVIFSWWFYGKNDRQKYAKYFAIYFISRSFAITEADKI